MRTGVLCAVRGAVEADVVQALTTGRFEVTRRCADLAELLAAAAAGLGAVAVVSADVPGLDREAVRHLHGSGVWVVLVAGPRSHRQVDDAVLGADLVVDDATAATDAGLPDAVRTLLEEAARTGAGPGARAPQPGEPGSLPAAWGAPQGRHPEPGLHGVVDGAAGRPDPGRVVAVWGPTGAPGRTTVAVTLAAELAALGEGTLLVDADTYGGTVGPMLGLLDEAPGIAAVARAAATGPLGPFELASLTPALDPWLRVLTGISRAERWPEVTATALEALWPAARTLVPWTVVDTGFAVEQDEALSYDTRAPRRNVATLSALAEADLVVVVGAGDPIGLQRLVRALGDLAELGVDEGRRVVVVNRVRASATGSRPVEAIRDALARYAGVGDVHMVPDDRVACDGAVLAARTLREHAPGSPAHRAVAALTGVVLARSAPVGAH